MKKTLGLEYQRQRAIELALEHIGSGGTPYSAAVLAGVKYKSLWRWLKQVAENGGDIAAVATGKRIGRPPVVLLTEEEVLLVQARVKGDVSEVMALRLACMAGEVRGEVASVVMSLRRKHDIPGALRRQLKVAAAVRAYHQIGRAHV